MSTGAESLLSALRRPEYTGENRCTPCTVVNVAIAVAVSAVVGVASLPLAPVALGLCLAAIYLRGYLVPGTPELTKRYFPDRVLRWFDKAPNRVEGTLVGMAGEGEEIDPEPALLEADALELTPDGTDLRLTDEFEAEWNDSIAAVRESDYEPRLARILGADEEVAPDALDVQVDTAATTVFRNDVLVATWPSEAALLADVAAAPLLRERLPEWADANLAVRGQLLQGVRVFLDRCPVCGGDLALSEETVESCCRSTEVATLACTDCEARLLEVEV